MITANIGFANNTTGYRATEIYVNGTVKAYASLSAQTGTGYCGPAVSTVLYLAATDYVELYASQTSGGNLLIKGGEANINMTVTLLSI